MKKPLLYTLLLLCFAKSISAQVTDLGFPFSDPSIALTAKYSVPKPNVIWTGSLKVISANNAYFSSTFSRSIDGGKTWTEGTIAPSNQNLWMNNIQGLDENNAIATFFDRVKGTTGMMYRTTDGGKNWNLATSSDMYASATSFPNFGHMFSGKEGLMGGDPASNYYEIWRTEDSTKTWKRVPKANIPDPLKGEAFLTNYFQTIGNHVWFTTIFGRLYTSNDRGKTWKVSNTAFFNATGGAQGQLDVASVMRDTLNGIIVSNSSKGIEISNTTDGGKTFSKAFVPKITNDTMPLLAFSARNVPGTPIYLATIATGTTNDFIINLASSVDNGSTWQMYNIETQLGDVGRDYFLPTSSTTVYYSGGEGNVLKFEGKSLLGNKDNFNLIGTLKVFPNPTVDVAQIILPNEEKAVLYVYDMSGKMISQQDIQGTYHLNMSDWATGIYTIIAQGKEGIYLEKVTKH
jgi:photosystem II stability/assembly factor-like uncharacterized protein